MPTCPWKKAIVADGLLSGFRSKGSGSLVVQTGFPTSLADLIVKNHNRLKKSSRTKKKKPSPTSDPLTAGCGGGATRFQELECHLSDPVIESSASSDRSAGFGPGSRFLAGSLVVLAALVIGKKKFVLCITFSAFSLLLLEFCGLRNWRFRKPKRLDSLYESFDLRGRESVSPIREISVGHRAGLPVSNAKREESRIPQKCSELFSKNHDLADVCRQGKLESSVNSKAKKLLRKFMLKKIHGARENGRIPHCVEATVEELSEKDLLGEGKEEADNDDEVQCFKTFYGNSGDGEENDKLHRNMDGNKLSRHSQLVFFLIVLCGLVRGKTIAILLALAWCFLLKFIEVVSKE